MEKRSFKPENVPFCEKCFLPVILAVLEKKIVKRELHQDDYLVKNDLTVQICGKRAFQPENVRFSEKWFFAVI